MINYVSKAAYLKLQNIGHTLIKERSEACSMQVLFYKEEKQKKTGNLCQQDIIC
jgi:hypothetical protein